MKSIEPKVFIVDDDPSILRAVSRLLRSAGFAVNTFDSPQEFIDKSDVDAHGCCILDYTMPGYNGIQLQSALTAKGVLLPILFLTARADVPISVRAMKQGAVDFLIKPIDDAQLVAAVRAAIEMDRIASMARAEAAAIRSRLATLTPREYEVFEHAVSGKLNKQTAFALGTVEKTIKVHRARVMEKLQVETFAGLVRLAERAGINSISVP